MNTSKQKIIPHLWFDEQAEEAAEFYISLFDGSKKGVTSRYSKEGFEIHGQPEGKVMTVEFELDGFQMIALNGGPLFSFSPAISFFVVCESEAEADELWKQLSEGGKVLMELGKYDWSEKYGWVEDRFGLSWQISLGKMEDVGQKITPSLMYVSEEGRAEDAVNFYTSLFDDSDIVGIYRNGAGTKQPEGTVMHAQFHLNKEVFMAMDSSPEHADFTFNEAISLLISCEDQQEVDYFWNKLTQGGDPNAQQCGWLKDTYGVSWQVSPVALHQMLLSDDSEKVARVTKAFLQMKKFDIRKLQVAFEGYNENQMEQQS